MGWSYSLDKSACSPYHLGIQLFFWEGKYMAKTAMTHARLTPEVKEKAEAILRELGISISAAYEMFYRQIIVHHGLPFEPHLPNEKTLRAMEDARAGKGKKYASVEKMFTDLGI
jgi:DNA-damage-inducible protein J